MKTGGITYQLLQQQNAETSNAIIEHFQQSPLFHKLANFEGELILRRDQEDADKLQKGIDFAKAKGVVDPNFQPEPYITIDVLGKSPDEVASIILKDIQSDDPSSSKEGTVVVLVGLSGTGKGTTVSKLKSALEATGKPVVTWSNGNIFRSVTLLAVTWCEQHNQGILDITKACSAENLRHFMSMLSFEPITNGEEEGSSSYYDTHIHGLGLDLWVNQVQNTTLKAPSVAANIPAVAEYTQGEVIVFAAQAVQTLCHAGYTVLLEGREQTVNYVRTPHRFALVLSDESLIGQRRAAQRIMAAALEDSPNADNNDDVTPLVTSTLEELVQELQ